MLRNELGQSQSSEKSRKTLTELGGQEGLSLAQVRSSYRRYAPVYDILFGASLGPGRMAMTRLVSSLGPEKILEVGVGTGLTLAHYPSKSEITGIDVSAEMLISAKRRADEIKKPIVLQQMDAEAMDFSDHTFDCVTVPYVLSVTPNPDKLIAEIRRVCKPEGYIVVVNHFSGQPKWRFIETIIRPISGWLGFRSEFSLDRNVMRHDWSILSIEPVNLLSLSRLILIRNG